MTNNLEYYKSLLLEETNDLVIITDNNLEAPNGPKIEYVNKAFERISGYTREEVIGKTPRILQGEKTDKAVLRRIKKSLMRGESLQVELLNYSKSGQEYWLDFSVTPLYDRVGNIAHFAAIERDVTENKRLQDNLYQLATTDALTGAMNRNHFYECCLNSFANYNRNPKNLFSLMVIDVDNFKTINDTYGHLEGDNQLKQIANVCQKYLRKNDLFCRFGGDEFIAVLHNACQQDLAQKADASLQSIRQDNLVKTTVSIGATTVSSQDSTIDDLISRADKALYTVKCKSKGLYGYLANNL